MSVAIDETLLTPGQRLIYRSMIERLSNGAEAIGSLPAMFSAYDPYAQDGTDSPAPWWERRKDNRMRRRGSWRCERASRGRDPVGVSENVRSVFPPPGVVAALRDAVHRLPRLDPIETDALNF